MIALASSSAFGKLTYEAATLHSSRLRHRWTGASTNSRVSALPRASASASVRLCAKSRQGRDRLADWLDEQAKAKDAVRRPSPECDEAP